MLPSTVMETDNTVRVDSTVNISEKQNIKIFIAFFFSSKPILIDIYILQNSLLFPFSMFHHLLKGFLKGNYYI